MEKIRFSNKEIKCRKESQGYTIFDGYNAILANDTFVFILKLIESKKSITEIQNILIIKYDLSFTEKDLVIQDIRRVKDFIKSKNWQ